MHVSAIQINFFVKIGFASLLLLLLIINCVKITQGVMKGMRTITPAIVIIYFLFFAASILGIILAVVDNKVSKNFEKKIPVDEMIGLIRFQLGS